jgi:hypothetical protein
LRCGAPFLPGAEEQEASSEKSKMRAIHQVGNATKYAISASEMRSIPFRCPGFQREAVEEHVAAIVAYQASVLRERGHVAFTGCITLCQYGGEVLCIDGQHRLHAARALLDLGAPDFEFVVEVIECGSVGEVHELFRVVNANRPVPRFLLDSAESTAIQMREHIRLTYPGFISVSARPNVPNVNLDAFVQATHDRCAADLRAASHAAGGVGAWVDARNEEHRVALVDLAQKYERVAHGLAAIEREYKSASKSRGARFYLGCFWLESPKKQALSKPLRRLVWRAWFKTVACAQDPDGDVPCPCCESARISAFDFHLGHKRSSARGGTDEPANLVPLCAGCNLGMGTRDFDEYRMTLRSR